MAVGALGLWMCRAGRCGGCFHFYFCSYLLLLLRCVGPALIVVRRTMVQTPHSWPGERYLEPHIACSRYKQLTQVLTGEGEVGSYQQCTRHSIEKGTDMIWGGRGACTTPHVSLNLYFQCEMSFEELAEWALGEMEDVFSPR